MRTGHQFWGYHVFPWGFRGNHAQLNAEAALPTKQVWYKQDTLVFIRREENLILNSALLANYKVREGKFYMESFHVRQGELYPPP